MRNIYPSESFVNRNDEMAMIGLPHARDTQATYRQLFDQRL